MDVSAFQKQFPHVDEASFVALDSVTLNWGDFGHHATLAGLLGAWAYAVNRFARELDNAAGDNPETGGVWHEYDYFATLLSRDRLESAIGQASGSTQSLSRRLSEEVDDRFRSITARDDSDLMLAFREHANGPDGSVLSDAWWWGFVPVRGPVIEGLHKFESERASGT
jgi:hypothetical protein